MPSTSVDPFAGVIGELESSLSSAKGLVAPLQSATTVVVDFDNGLLAVKDIDGVLKALTDITELLDSAVAALSPVPVIGEIADVFESAVLEPATSVLADATALFDKVSREVVQPAIDVLTDLKTGLQKITAVVRDVTITVPQYLNTVQVLSYLLDIAQPLTGVLKGTTPGDRLAVVVDTLQTVKNDVGKALRPFADGVQAIQHGVQPVADELQKIFAGMGSGAKKAIADLQAAGKLLKPIADGFHKALDAIAPVRWVLDAVACIVKKILMPVVNWILKVTGLDSLVDEAKKKVLGWIGIQPVLDAVQKGVSPGTMASDGSAVNDHAGSASATAFEDLGKALGKYRTNRSEALKDATFGLVSAITGTPVDPNKATEMPTWPERPQLDGNDTSSTSATPAALAAYGFGDADPHGELRRHFACALAVHSTVAGQQHVEPLSLLRLSAKVDAAPVAPIDSSKWPASAAFVNDVSDAVGSVTALSKAAATLSTSLTSFQASLALPAQFGAQIAALTTSFKTCDDLVKLLSEFDLKFLDTILQPVDAILQSQVADAEAVNAAVPALQKAVQSLSAATQSVLAQMPGTSVIDTAVHRMDGWVLGLQQLIATMEDGYSRAVGDTATLDSGKAQIEANAKALGDRLETLAKAVQDLTSCIAGLQQGLDTYSSSLASVSSHSQTISTSALPSIQHVAVILGKIDSIFDPLSCLLKAENCVDASASQKAWAQAGCLAIQTTAQTAATPPPSSFTELLEEFAEKELPLGQIQSAVKTATTAINTKSVTAFEKGTSTLSSSLATLTKALQQTQKYSFTDPATGKTYDAPNDLVDQTFVDHALAAIKA